MKVLTKDQIREVKDIHIVPVEVPEWGGSVHVRALSVRERETLEAGIKPKNGAVDTRGFRVKVVIAATVTEDGTQMFNKSDAGWLTEKAASAIERIAEAALEHNGMTEDAGNDAEGKSEDEPGNASSTGSPSGSADPWPMSETA